MTNKQLDDIKSSHLKELEGSRPKKREPLNIPPDKADSFRKKFESCLPKGARKPTEKEIIAFITIMEYYPNFKKDQNGMKALADIYSHNSDLSKAVLNGWYQTAESFRK